MFSHCGDDVQEVVGNWTYAGIKLDRKVHAKHACWHNRDLHFLVNWCPEEDSNLHVHTDTST